jgi:hypothetical protein
MIAMMIRRENEGISSIEMEHPHTIAKTVCMHGTAQQILKQAMGSHINYDYELLHYLDQQK